MATIQISLIAAIGLLTVYLVYTFRKLGSIPGPFWGRISNLPRVNWVKTGRSHEIHQDLHRKYGDVVRFGPNMVSVADPACIPVIYPMRPGFPKGQFYRALMPYTGKGKSLPAVFNTRDEAILKQIKSPIAPLFSLSNVLTLEPFVTRTLEVLLEQFDARFVQTGKTFDLADWLQYYSFDVMGTLTLSKRYGFLEHGKDVNGMLLSIWNYFKAAAPMTQIPWFDEIWNKNSWVNIFTPPGGFSILRIVRGFIEERQKLMEEKGNVYRNKKLHEKDMLSRFLELQQNNPSIPPWSVMAWTFSNVFAGSDSTAAILRAIWYNLLAHPHTLERLHNELKETEQTRGLKHPIPDWGQVSDLPYLDACINEAVRLHPPFCLPFERVVPHGGITIGAHYLPEGTVVGMSPYVTNRHRPTFGEDADEWNPDRWLCEDEQQRKKLEQSILTFGAGRRVCLGKHVAVLEIKKLIPTLLLNYEFKLLDPKRYRLENFWFFQPQGIDVKIRKRANTERQS
ncbi:hypothetical protein UA08_00991 [Talaromyces atroroseus]|uniref:Pisatin demethylase n=1 Tax=Talaromyces atroroseus TaxID=1441469 RepID=A0A225BC27_TALAT|nr:hypothetical protein UA08_00991 [Talaromyces atroroseus]OKL64465.1 hypothetical protein UA08_00991 [Talaromyces atroroseus]